LPSIQQIEDKVLTDIVHATPYAKQEGRKKDLHACFDTVLVHYSAAAQDTDALGELMFRQGKYISD